MALKPSTKGAYLKMVYNLDKQQTNALKSILLGLFGEPVTGQVIIHLKTGGVLGLEAHKFIDTNGDNGG